MTRRDRDDLLVITAQRIAMLVASPPVDDRELPLDLWTSGGTPLPFTLRHTIATASDEEWRAAINVALNLADLAQHVRGMGGTP